MLDSWHIQGKPKCIMYRRSNHLTRYARFSYTLYVAPIDPTNLANLQVSAALAGLAAGALFFCPFALVIGRSAVTFWSLVGSLACAVWSARMTHEDDYVKFIISRMLSGMFGSVPSALGGGTIMDIFFLHQRGKAFMVFSLCLQLGAVSGPTFGAFIVEYQSWTVCFWWTVALLGVTAILVLLFSEETNFNRKLRKPPVATPKSFLSNRIATFCPGTAITPRCNLNGFVSTFQSLSLDFMKQC